MSEQSLAPETAFTVASTFLAYYYSEFVKLNELARMSDLYDERSYMTLVDFRDEVPVVAHGRNAVANLLAKLDSSLGQRKVEIITVDTVALPHNCVQVICQGVMYLREYRRVFLHVFVLEPTAYRTKTYHISSDYLRFVDSEKEVIPEGAVVIPADQVQNYLEESRRRIEEEQRRQLLEFQQRIRAQQEAAAKAKAEAEAAQAAAAAAAAAAAKAHQEQQQAAMRIPQPASRQPRNPNAPQHGGAEAPPHQQQRGGERRDRPERPDRRSERRDAPQQQPRGERPERPERADRRPAGGAEEGQHNNNNNNNGPSSGGRPDRKPREAREPRAERGDRPERKPRADRPDRPERGERKPAAAAVEGAGEKPAGEKPARPERKPREPREPREPRAAPAADGAAAAAAGAAAERRPRRETGPTAACIVKRVPKKIKLSDIKAEWESQGGAAPTDMFWCGPNSSHAVLKFESVEKATALFSKKTFAIQEESLTVDYYYDEKPKPKAN